MPELSEKTIVESMKVEIFPLASSPMAAKLNEGAELLIRDHVNLSGSSPKGIGFIPITDLYVDENGEKVSEAQGIVVACLKEGVKLSAEEEKVLVDNGVSAYSYSLINEALAVAARSNKLTVRAFVPKLPKGFKALGLNTGYKESGNKDLGIIFSEETCDWVGVFTQNKIRAACVTNNENMQANPVRAIICNSGPANACTGEEGHGADIVMRELLARKLSTLGLKTDKSEVLAASTGKIGVTPDLARIEKTLDTMDLANSDVYSFAEAILTTDTATKIYQTKHITGFTKGSGMIEPNMATMLAFMLTDARVVDEEGEPLDLQDMHELLKDISDESFNCISVDGDTSTNDMALLLANNMGPEISVEEFAEELFEVSVNLAKKIALDGEGISKLIEVSVLNASSKEDARKIGKSVIRSNLVKTAIFGCDPNWGRILAAIGYSGAQNIEEKKIKLSILGCPVYAEGNALISDAPDRVEARDELALLMKKNPSITIDIDMGLESNEDTAETFFGNDLGYDYVRINAEYFT